MTEFNGNLANDAALQAQLGAALTAGTLTRALGNLGLGVGVTPSLFNNAYFATAIGLGDSRIQSGPVDSPTTIPTAVYDDKFLTWVKVFSNGKIKFIYDAGIAGQTSTQVLARIQADVIARSPDMCFLWMAANDAPNSFNVTISFGNITSAATQCINAGIIPIVIAESPHVTTPGGTTGQYAAYYVDLNNRLRQWCATNKVRFVDAWAIGVNPASTTGACINNASSIYLEDTIHPAANYCRKLGRACVDNVSDLLASITDANVFPSSIFDYVGNNSASRQVMPNPLFGGTGGTPFGTSAVITNWTTTQVVTAGTYRLNAGNVYFTLAGGTCGATAPTHTQSIVPISDGGVFWQYVGNGAATIPNGWFAGQTVGTSTASLWTETRADGLGNNLCMACVGGAANDECEINSGSFSANLLRGDTLTGGILLSIQNAVNLAGVYVTVLTANTGGSTMTNTLLQNSFGGLFFDDSDVFDLGCIVQPIIIPVDGSALSQALIKVRVVFNGAGRALVKTGRAFGNH